MSGRLCARIALLVGTLASAFAAATAQAKPPTVFDPVVEARNYSITLQRQSDCETQIAIRSPKALPAVSPAEIGVKLVRLQM